MLTLMFGVTVQIKSAAYSNILQTATIVGAQQKSFLIAHLNSTLI
jgi:hypothetical protein